MISAVIHAENTGGVWSSTMTLNTQVETFPDPSVAVYVTTVVPSGNTSPGAWVDVNAGVPQLSVVVGGVQVAIPSQDPLAGTTMSAGMHPDITGFVSSLTITLKEHVAVFPSASVAVYVTTVVPSGNVSPGL